MSDFAVFDGWLTPADLAAVRAFLKAYRYFSSTPSGKRGPNGTLAELEPLLAKREVRLLGGPFVVYRTDPAVKTERDLYPSGTALDLVIASVLARLPEVEPWLGKGWQLLGAGPRHYPRGRGLPRHDDARFAGTFTLYVHEAWEPEWGGRLVVEGASEPVFPEPNRMVFLRAGTPHVVEPVTEAAGERLRMSVIGYTYAKGSTRRSRTGSARRS